MGIAERIKEVMDYYNYNSGEFANKLKVQKSSISHLLSGRNKPSFVFLNKLATALPDINIEWFVTGKGEMNKSKPSENMLVESNVGELESGDEGESELVSDPVEKDITPTKHPKQASPKIKQIVIFYDDDTFKVLDKTSS